jgi:hypothetical protein
VEANFSAVATGVAEFRSRLLQAASAHRLVVLLGKVFAVTNLINGRVVDPDCIAPVVDAISPIKADGCVENQCLCHDQGRRSIDDAMARDIAPRFVQASQSPKALYRGIKYDEYNNLLTQLDQEYYRACLDWPRWPDTEVASSELSGTSKRSPRERPAYHRDHLFLRWKLEEKMTPAPILDRWNSMSDEELRKVSPRCWHRIEGAGGRQGDLCVVKKALARAQKDRNAAGEN